MMTPKSQSSPGETIPVWEASNRKRILKKCVVIYSKKPHRPASVSDASLPPVEKRGHECRMRFDRDDWFLSRSDKLRIWVALGAITPTDSFSDPLQIFFMQVCKFGKFNRDSPDCGFLYF